ncbi:hypothetical protein C8Q74DRAFT_1295088 [Fomes fomentarius]|nr:hypothetical protein C8Q74DRAFT_1295088 [Fomes fomentarius]
MSPLFSLRLSARGRRHPSSQLCHRNHSHTLTTCCPARSLSLHVVLLCCVTTIIYQVAHGDRWSSHIVTLLHSCTCKLSISDVTRQKTHTVQRLPQALALFCGQLPLILANCNTHTLSAYRRF